MPKYVYISSARLAFIGTARLHGAGTRQQRATRYRPRHHDPPASFRWEVLYSRFQHLFHFSPVVALPALVDLFETLFRNPGLDEG